jgi:hypothetical protein
MLRFLPGYCGMYQFDHKKSTPQQSVSALVI